MYPMTGDVSPLSTGRNVAPVCPGEKPSNGAQYVVDETSTIYALYAKTRTLSPARSLHLLKPITIRIPRRLFGLLLAASPASTAEHRPNLAARSASQPASQRLSTLSLPFVSIP